MSKRFPILPAHPERICWGCDRYCRADDMACGNGSLATPHPAELFGEDWLEWGLPPGQADRSCEPKDESSPQDGEQSAQGSK